MKNSQILNIMINIKVLTCALCVLKLIIFHSELHFIGYVLNTKRKWTIIHFLVSTIISMGGCFSYKLYPNNSDVLFVVICFCSRPVTKTSKTQIWSENVNAKTSFQVMSTLLSSRDIVLKIYCAQVCSPTQWSKANRWPPV